MARGGNALVPLLTLAGTATAAFVAYKMTPKRPHRSSSSSTTTPRRRRVDSSSSSVASSFKAKKSKKLQREQQLQAIPPTKVPCGSAMLLMCVFGISLMALVVLVALALMVVDESLASPLQLDMFAPLMYVALGMVTAGIASVLLRPSEAPIKALTVTSQSVKAGHDEETDEDEGEDEEEVEAEDTLMENEPKPRVSKCPFGFG